MCGRGFAPRICSCSHQICYPELNRDCRFYKMQKFMRLPFPPPHIYRRLKNRHRKEPCAGPAPKPDGSSRFFSPENPGQPRLRHHRQIPPWATSERGAGGHISPYSLPFPGSLGGFVYRLLKRRRPDLNQHPAESSPFRGPSSLLRCVALLRHKKLTLHLLHIPAFAASVHPAELVIAKRALQPKLCQQFKIVCAQKR